MELVLTTKELEPLPKQKSEPFIFKNEGLLNSNYKQTINKNFFNSCPQSIFGAKQRVKSRLYKKSLGVEAVLKFSVFIIALVAVLS